MLRIDTGCGELLHRGGRIPVAIGKGGAVAAAHKHEGDGATPLGEYRALAALLRPDRVQGVVPALPWRWLRPADGWSDDPADPEYNRPVSHPHRFHAERLWRDDGLYDAIVVLDHNSAPVVPGMGSAIFLHIAAPDHAPTEGCIAMAREALLAMLPLLNGGAAVEII